MCQYPIRYCRGAAAAARRAPFLPAAESVPAGEALGFPRPRWQVRCRHCQRRARTRTPTGSSCPWQFTPRDVLPGYHHGGAISSSRRRSAPGRALIPADGGSRAGAAADRSCFVCADLGKRNIISSIAVCFSCLFCAAKQVGFCLTCLFKIDFIS